MRRMPVERGDGARPCLYGRVVPGSAELHVRRDRDSRGGSFRRFFRAAFLPAMGERARRGELEIVELPVHMRIVLKDAGGTREEEERGMYRYTPRGVCSRAIDIDLDGDKVARVEFVGGCDGNLKAVSRLIEGMTVEDVAAALEGNTCGRRATSCADQLVKGLREARQAAV